MSFEKRLKTQSPLEIRFLEDCLTVGIVLVPQYAIGHIHADFAIPDMKLAIEVDSTQWHSSEQAKMNDARRDKIYDKYGWYVLRVTGKEIMKSGEKIAEELREIIAELKENGVTDIHKLSHK